MDKGARELLRQSPEGTPRPDLVSGESEVRRIRGTLLCGTNSGTFATRRYRRSRTRVKGAFFAPCRGRFRALRVLLNYAQNPIIFTQGSFRYWLSPSDSSWGFCDCLRLNSSRF